MEEAANGISELLKILKREAKVGVNLLHLASFAESFITISGWESVNKGYHPQWAKTPFPSVVCLSVNEEIAHGAPYNYELQDGDLLTIDCGIKVNNFCADAGFTIPIGTISNRDERLLRYAEKVCLLGIKQIKPGIKVTEIGKTIEWYVKNNGYVIVKGLAGHGIGKVMHEAPTIPMYDVGLQMKVIDEEHKKYEYTEYENIPVLQAGQVICIEPHLTYRDEYGKIDVDNWTVRTRDGKKCAMFEHMVEVTDFGYRILTSHF